LNDEACAKIFQAGGKGRKSLIPKLKMSVYVFRMNQPMILHSLSH